LYQDAFLYFRANGIESLESLRKAARNHGFGGASDLERLGDFPRSKWPFSRIFNFNFLTVFVDDTDGQPETGR